jgi:hypothetical protein
MFRIGQPVHVIMPSGAIRLGYVVRLPERQPKPDDEYNRAATMPTDDLYTVRYQYHGNPGGTVTVPADRLRPYTP